MIYLIHGRNEVDSRRFLTRLKASYGDTKIIEGKNLNQQALAKYLREASNNLFGGRSSLLVEGFGGQIDILPGKTPKELDLILWSNKKIFVTSKNLKSFLFDRSTKPNTFKLADAILFKQERQSQILLNQLLQSKEPPEKIIGTINRGLCMVYFALENSIGKTTFSPYIKQKYIDQSKYWSKLSIRKGLLRLLQTDLLIKSGTRPQICLGNLLSHLTN